MARRTLAAVFCSLVPASVLFAQRVVSSVDVSGTSVWYADTTRATGTSLTPAVRLDWARATIGASATVSELRGGSTSFQGTIAPSVFSPNAGPFTMELAGSLGGSKHEDGTSTGQTIGSARAYYMREGGGAWVGGGLGRTWDGVTWRAMRQGEAGTWIQSGIVTALASVSPVVVQDTIQYTDLQAALRYPLDRYEFGFTAGRRVGSVGPIIGGTARTWGSVSALAWLTRRVALVGSAGNYPVDLTQGYPGGRFISVAVRIASRNTRSVERGASSSISSPAALALPENEAREAGVTAFEVRDVGGTQRSLRVKVASARDVEINGDFTHWKPVALAPAADGWWAVTLPIGPGTYQMNVRVDGGPWLAPPGLLTTSDEFGGKIGILTIQ